LVYYKNAETLEREEHPKGLIHLNGSKLDVTYVQSYPNLYAFSIETPSRTFVLLAKTNEERLEWMLNLKSVIGTPIDK